MNLKENMYVPKKEVKPIRNQFHIWMDNIHEELKDKGISFTYILVGSAKRNLVIKHHNQGFDCDYQIRISANRDNLTPFEIKNAFINALNNIVIDYGYKKCSDSTSAITIKKVGNESNIENGYDVVIIQETENGVEILRNKKVKHNKSDYVFEMLPDMKGYREQFAKIKGPKMWKTLRDIYFEKKIKELGVCRTGKKSFQLLNEAVNDTLNKA